MSVKQLQTKVEKLKARITARQSELADLKAQHKDARAKLMQARKAKKTKPTR
jgi:predicted  nucleic acid-binding Zn-ribbon protein